MAEECCEGRSKGNPRCGGCQSRWESLFQSFANSTSQINESLDSLGIIAAEGCPVYLAPRLTDSNHCQTPTQTILCGYGSLLTPNARSEARQRAWIPSLGFVPGAAFPTRERTRTNPNNSCWSLPRGQSENCLVVDQRGRTQWFRDKVQVGPAFSLAEESRRML
jgi:hypothetical protein